MALLALDIGNSFTKIGVFDAHAPRFARVATDTLTSSLPTQLADWQLSELREAAWVSVSQTVDLPQWPVWAKMQVVPRHIRATDPLPIVQGYATPETLGPDRIVAAIGAYAHSGQQPVLVIDAGTALTYDCIDAAGVYRGGAIAPGLGMRFQALHHFTANLPLVSPTDNPPLIGDSTQASIQSGVLNGMRAEMVGTIADYRPILGPEMHIYLTGGDASYFVNHLKSSIFADPYLVLRGIHYILTQQQSI